MQSPFQPAFEQTLLMGQKIARGIAYWQSFREDDITIGATPKEAVYQEDRITLYRFQVGAEHSSGIPLLIVYALINRPLMVDLQEDRSLVANLLNLGLDVYLIDWGYPTRTDRWLTLDDYINGYINNCIDFVCKTHGLSSINLLGICQGGTFSLCYSALYPEKVKNLVVMVTPVNFHMNNSLLNQLGGCTLGAEALDVDLLVKAQGNIPGDYLNAEFVMLKPWQLGVQKYLNLFDIMDDEEKLLNFFRMEKWIFDSPDQAGEAYRQFLKDFYQGNKLIKGEVMLGGKRVDLSNITAPILNLYAEKDHLVPPASSLALEQGKRKKNVAMRC